MQDPTCRRCGEKIRLTKEELEMIWEGHGTPELCDECDRDIDYNLYEQHSDADPGL